MRTWLVGRTLGAPRPSKSGHVRIHQSQRRIAIAGVLQAQAFGRIYDALIPLVSALATKRVFGEREMARTGDTDRKHAGNVGSEL